MQLADLVPGILPIAYMSSIASYDSLVVTGQRVLFLAVNGCKSALAYIVARCW